MKKIAAMLLALMLCAACALGASAQESTAQDGYVLMNIPYAAFYEAEVPDASGLDAVASATLMKPRAAALAGGSYHVDPEGSDITGVTFPVYVEDMGVLRTLGGKEITDADSVAITVTLKGEESTTTFEGRDALFEAPSWSWYVLSDTSAAYKPLNADGSVGAIVAETTALAGSAAYVYDRHMDMVVKVSGIDDALADRNVSGVILTADDGTRVALRHIANLWRKSEIGFNLDSDVYAALKGKRIASIEYITLDGMYTVAVDLPVSDDELLPRLNGTYIDLFPEFAKEEYKDYWLECLDEYGIEGETAEQMYAGMTQGFMGTLKGQAAVDAYGGDPSSMVFDCYLENGLKSVTVNGDVIRGADADGNEVFCHAYHYLENVDVTFFGQPTGTQLRVYAANDADAGMFTYFAFTDDTIAATQHVEFRYGETLDNMGSYDEGEYAYWLAGAINDNYKEKQIKACIKLFVDENAGEEAEAAEVIEIATAEQLAAVNDNLSGSYALSADIDLSGIEWTPIGAFVPSGEGEDQEIPSAEYAFTGTFDGQGHTISNLTVNQPEGFSVGLFGCIAGASVSNLNVDNASVDGSVMVSDVIGYSYMSNVSGVTLTNGKVTAHAGDMSEEGMYGGIVAAGMGSTIADCAAQADIVLPDNTANAGIVGGGLEMTSVVRCEARGSVTAGNNCYGLGGVSGCGFGAPEFTDCLAEDVAITAGDNCFWIGGITGYAGGYEDESFGFPVTMLTRCIARNVTVETGENVDGVGDIVGGGFYSEEAAAAMGAPFDQPTTYTLAECGAE